MQNTLFINMISPVVKRIFFPAVLGLVGMFILVGCQNKSLNIFGPKSPREQYTDKLNNAGLSDTKTGRLWTQSAINALENAPGIEIPARLEGSFKSRTVSALAWRFDLQKGASVEISVQWSPADSSKLFVDLIQWTDGPEIRKSIVADDEVHRFEIKKTGTYIMRLQPELFGEGNFILKLNGAATYGVFPVEGKDSHAVLSFWGVDRDGGARRHEGIDIFAARGTPVLSPVDGWVTSVREGGLGGKQVWVRDNARGHSLYFAHLDSQAVHTAKRVSPGDTLGFVGNTGNARFTKPHLHFGIYSGGAFDPFPMVNNIHSAPGDVNISYDEPFMNTTATQVNLRLGPGTEFEVIGSLPSRSVVFVESVTRDWYQVKTPDGFRGFIFHTLLSFPEINQMADSSAYVFTKPSNVRPDSIKVSLSDFRMIGNYLNYHVLVDDDGNIYYSNKR